MSEKISVIIPIYNTEPYLRRCLDSVLSQSYKNLEILLIDDGSKDGSGSICDEYSTQYENVRTFHLENGGVCKARNFALTQITGEWFSFVDSDDWLEKDFFKVLYENAVENGCTVSGCGYYMDTEYRLVNKFSNKILVLDSPKACVKNYICPGLSLNGMSCMKIYKSSEYKDARFDTSLKVNEDCVYTYDVLSNCNRACVSTARMYHWFYRDDSACHAKQMKLDFSRANVFLNLTERELIKGDEEICQRLRHHYVNSAVTVLLGAEYKFKDPLVQETIKKCKELKKEVWTTFSKKDKLKYILVIRFNALKKVARKINEIVG